LTATTHGKDADAEEIAENFLGAANVMEPSPNAKFLCPPPPISQTESNWPLLSVSKGFFERASAVAVAAAGEGAGKGAGGALAAADDEMGEVGGAWGEEDDLELDEDGEPIRKGRGGAGDDEDGAGDGEGGWDEDDLELPPELEQAIAQVGQAIHFQAIHISLHCG
jgi:coatomer protein complex subunit alpha (xenin)